MSRITGRLPAANLLLLSLSLFFFLLSLSKASDSSLHSSSSSSSSLPSSSSWTGGFTDTWIYRFLSNFIGYAVILFPLFVFVLLIKKRILLSEKHPLYHSRIVQLIVYGRSENSFAYSALPVSNQDAQRLQTSFPGSLGSRSQQGLLSGFNSWFDSQSKFSRDILTLAYCFVGLQLSYLTWGVLQEKIMTQEYEMEIGVLSHHRQLSSNLISLHKTESKDSTSEYHIKFRNSQFLVFINRLLAFWIAFSILCWRNRSNLINYFFYSRQPALYQYSYCALTNILSSWCQYEALKYVSFPVQILSKGMKTLAVMLMSQCLRGKRYKKTEWAFTLAISVGIWLFLLNEQSEEASKHTSSAGGAEIANHYMASGIIILGLYLAFDSFTTNWQAALFDTYKLTPLHMMMMINGWSILLTSTSLLAQSDLLPAFKLLLINYSLLKDCVLLSICSAVGQLFIYFTISRFDAVVFTLIMTLRQVFAILLSIFIYAHSISIFGCLGIIVVFGSLFSQMYYKYRQKREPKKTIEKPPLPPPPVVFNTNKPSGIHIA